MSGHDPELYFAEDGAPRSARFGDIYYSLQDGLSEARAVFLTGCHLPDAWSAAGDFSVLELGFGTGLNIAALLQLWAANRPPDSHLHIFTIEGFLMSREDAASALGNWPDIAEFATAILDRWPKARRGFHYMDFPQWGVSLTLALMDVRTALSAWEGQADAVFLDGFSPTLNQDMWAEDVLASVAAKARLGTRLATFTVAGFVRRGLQAAGFKVEKCPGFGRKRERLEAVFEGGEGARTSKPKRIAIIGAGIAGASLAYHARRLGIAADIYDMTGVGAGASGNIAALVTPRLDAGDATIAGLFADALSYATDLYRRVAPDAVAAEGSLQCENGPRDADRFDKITHQDIFARGDIQRFRPGDAAELPSAEGLRLNAAIAVEPKAILNALLGNQTVRNEAIGSCRSLAEGGVEIETSAGTRTYDAVVLACGDGMIDLFPEFDLRSVRGQVEQVVSPEKPEKPASWGGYAVPLPDGFIFGATHGRGDRAIDIRHADRDRNLDTLCKQFPDLAAIAKRHPLQSRASIRVATRDQMAAAGRMGGDIFVLTGLGGRGFCLAPLLARAVMAELGGFPYPLSVAAKKILRPDRLRRI